MAPVEPNETFRITALCIRRLCFGYRNKHDLPSSTVKPDIFSVSIVVGTAFLVFFLMIGLLQVLFESIRVLTLSRCPSGCDSVENIADFYNKIMTAIPPSFPSEKGTCSICLEDYTALTIGRRMTCDHFFHVACIDGWILRSASKRWPRNAARCPICKQPVLKEEVQELPVEHIPLTDENADRYANELNLAENMV